MMAIAASAAATAAATGLATSRLLSSTVARTTITALRVPALGTVVSAAVRGHIFIPT
jgi:hypothetical protein